MSDMSSFQRTKSAFSRYAAAALLTAAAAGVAGEACAASSDRWVTDNLSTFVRSGPTDGYRIVGKVNAGQPVTVLSSQNDYTQIRTDSGDSVWIPSDQLQENEGASARAPKLEQQVAELTKRLDGIDDEWKNKVASMQQNIDGQKQYIEELEGTRSRLNQQLESAQADARDAKAQVGNERQQVLMRYFAYGGSVGGIGLLLGLVLPNMIPKRKKRKGNWF
ncbi:TIGR04211 family SH3 domain-containing protein [Carnimonas bestiolae]|uniref:TIGR04211 family SH3 domain-containing protein n=2 Tax=Carnimonas bestiolae TaxID=3402172 RepID=UPI003F4AABFE